MKLTFILPVLLFLSAFLLRITLLDTEFIRTMDSVEYINVADNIASGQGFIKTLKVYLIDDKPVIGSGSLLRPLFVPLIYAVLLAINKNYYFLQFFNLFLSAVNVILFYFLAKYFLKRNLAFVAAIIIAFNPNLIIDSRFIISEQIFYCLVLSFFLFYFRLIDAWGKYALLGAIAALAYLTRIEGVLLLVTLILTKFYKPFYLGITILCFFLLSLQNFFLNFQATGNPFYSFYSFHLSVLNYRQIQENFYSFLPAPIDFIKDNIFAIMQRIETINIGNITTLIRFRFLGFLSLLLILPIFKKKISGINTLTPIILFSIFFYLTVTVIWSVAFQPERHLALLYMLLIIILFFIAERNVSIKLLYIISIITLCIYFTYDVHEIWWVRANSAFFQQKNDQSFAWIRQHTNKNDIIATRDPWTMYVFTHKPSIILPYNFPLLVHEEKEFKKYIQIYNVKYIYVN